MPTIIVCEAGKNFIDTALEQSVDVNLRKAKELARQAKDCGADYVKFQTHEMDELEKRSEARYEWIQRNIRATPLEEFWKPLKKYCLKLGIGFMTTPMSKDAADKIENLVNVWKIGSADITDMKLLEFVRNTGKPIIISSGMSFPYQVEEAVEYLKEKDVTLMHCVSMYPCSDDKLNLLTIPYFIERYKIPVGYSDHSLSVLAPSIAVSLGAKVIEKHFTLNQEAFGPDHHMSMLPHQFREMVANIRITESMFGMNDKILLEEETKYWPNFRPNQKL